MTHSMDRIRIRVGLDTASLKWVTEWSHAPRGVMMRQAPLPWVFFPALRSKVVALTASPAGELTVLDTIAKIKDLLGRLEADLVAPAKELEEVRKKKACASSCLFLFFSYFLMTAVFLQPVKHHSKGSVFGTRTLPRRLRQNKVVHT